MATIFAQDALTETTTVALNGRVAPLGGSWVSVSGTSSSLGGTSGTMSVIANQGARTTSTTSPGVIAYLSDDAPEADYNIAFTTGNFGSTGFPGVAFRINGTSGYFITIATSYVALYKTVNGSRTLLNQTLGLQPLAPTSTFHDYELQVSGSKFTLFKAGAMLWEYEDATDPLTEPGKVGLFIRGDGRTINFSAYTVDGAIVSGTPESTNTSTAEFVGGWTKSGTMAAAGTTPTAYMQSATYRVGEMRNAAGESNARFDAIALITAQMYSLAQAPEPDFQSIGFSASVGDLASAGTSVAAFVGRANVSGDLSSSGVAGDAMLARAFGPGEAEFSAAGSASGALTAQRIVSAKMESSPKFDGDSFRFVGHRTIAGSFLAEGTSTASFTGYVSVRMAAEGSSTGSFTPTDVTVPATFSGSGSSIGAFKELEFAVSRFAQIGAIGTGRMTGVAINVGLMGSQGASIMSGWAGATVYSSQIASEGVMTGRMVSLSFSSNIATPADRVAALPAEDRLVTLTAEEREVLLPSEDREVLLPAEDRIAYL